MHDAGRYWDAHEAWEEAWRVERDDEVRRKLQGLIQITAAFHKLLVMRDARSAHRILLRGIAKLEGCSESAGDGLALADFRAAATRAAESLAGVDDAARFDASLVPRLM